MYAIPDLGGLGVLVTLVYVSQVGGGKRWIVFGTAMAIAGAAALVGGVVGFLFGIPLTSKQRTAAASGSQYETNTNLEQVSDWLTKIIVGVGLVQLGRALPALTRLAKSLNDPLGGTPYGGAFGLGLTIFYALLGFLFLYLWIAIRARLNITGWRLYEANRAVCNINILKGLPPGDPAQAEITASIEQDLARVSGIG